MAFYQKFEAKTSSQKRSAAFAKGGFEPEGSRYGGKKTARSSDSGKKSFTYNGKGEHRQYEKSSEKSFSSKERRYGEHSQGSGSHHAFEAKNTNRPYQHKSFGPDREEYKMNDRKGAGYRPARPEAQPEQKGFEQFRYQPAPRPAFAPDPAPRMEDHEENENLLSGRNPIREAIRSGRDIEKLMVARGELSGSAKEILEMARERRIPIQEVDRVRLDAITKNHQGMLAFASAYHYSTVEDMFALAESRNEPPFLILLDGITDPHNLGAIIRSAECAGAHGVIVQERRAVGLTAAAVKASAGAVEYIPVARVTNLSNTIELLKKRNCWVYAADMGGEDYNRVDLSGAVALVIGAEGEGIGHRVSEECDRILSLPIKGKIDSLNASVAAGILMYAVVKARS